MSRYLLDTHVWLWMEREPERLGSKTVQLVADRASSLALSTMSSLELAQLIERGRVSIKGDLLSWIDRSIERLSLESIPLTSAIAVRAYQLPGNFHSDPADRILVATARSQELVIITADERILAYPHVAVMDAGA